MCIPNILVAVTKNKFFSFSFYGFLIFTDYSKHTRTFFTSQVDGFSVVNNEIFPIDSLMPVFNNQQKKIYREFDFIFQML